MKGIRIGELELEQCLAGGKCQMGVHGDYGGRQKGKHPARAEDERG